MILRLSNLSFESAHVYRALSDLEFINYQENTPEQNARLLHESKLDIALIPVSEFANYGGYVGLDFGLIGTQAMREIVLLSNQPLSKTKTCYIDPGSSVGVALLRLLIKKSLNFTPQLVRTPIEPLLKELPEGTAVLLVGDKAQYYFDKFRFQIDLAEEWWSYTKLPFVACVWAFRPERFNRHLTQTLYEYLFRLFKADLVRHQRNFEYGKLKLIARREISYYLDPQAKEGLDLFLEEAAALSIVPNTRYQSSSYPLLDNTPKRISEAVRLNELLENVVSGQRLSVADAVFLAQKAPLPDLALAADCVRSKHFPTRSVRSVLKRSVSELRIKKEAYKAQPILERESLLKDIQMLQIDSDPSIEVLSLADWEEILIYCKTAFGSVSITALSVNEVEQLAITETLSIEQILARLIKAGLSAVRSLDQICSFEFLRSANRFGACSDVIFKIESEQSWQERILYLNQIRSLQDETPGFRSCTLVCSEFVSSDVQGRKGRFSKDIESRLRATMIARLFLDNMPHILERGLGRAGLMAIVGLSSGADEVEIVYHSKNASELSVLKSLFGVGMDFQSEKLPELERL